MFHPRIKPEQVIITGPNNHPLTGEVVVMDLDRLGSGRPFPISCRNQMLWSTDYNIETVGNCLLKLNTTTDGYVVIVHFRGKRPFMNTHTPTGLSNNMMIFPNAGIAKYLIRSLFPRVKTELRYHG